MTQVRIKIRQTKGGPKFGRKNAERAKQAAMLSVGWSWVKLYLDKHFTPSGAKSYRYKRRKTKNIFSGTAKDGTFVTEDGDVKKGPKAPDGRPLVWTGETFKNRKVRHVKATSRSAKVRFPMVRNINYNPEMVREFRTVTKREAAKLRSLARKRTLQVINSTGKKAIVSVT